MPNTENSAALIAEFLSLDPTRDAPRMRELLEKAIPQVDRAATPKKWAALCSRLGWLLEGIDPSGALKAYRKALEVWTRDEDHDSWVACHSGAGMSLFAMQPLRSEDNDEAITHLEAAVPDQPFLARALALLYQLRQHGDPLNNWRNRINYLELAQAQISRDTEPVKWAVAENELAVAIGEEPDGDFFKVMIARQRRHHAALDALGDSREAEYIETCMFLSETYLFGIAEDGVDITKTHILRRDSLKAVEFAKHALEAAALQQSTNLKGRAYMAVSRALALAGRKEDMQEVLKYLGEAIRIYHDLNKPELEANAMSLRANAKAQLIKCGEKEWVESMVKDAEDAVTLLDPLQYSSERRTVLQVEGEVLFDVGQAERAAGCFERAVAATREALAQATTMEGRMERIWQFRDSSALLSYCYLKNGREEDALTAMEDGKDRFWRGAAAL